VEKPGEMEKYLHKMKNNGKGGEQLNNGIP
jgi:hypothetical protein